MGRPTIYEIAMTPRERQRRRRAKLAATIDPEQVLGVLAAAYAAGGATSSLPVRRGRQRGPGGNSPNGAPAFAQPIACASSRKTSRYLRISPARACIVASGISGVELCDDHHTLSPLVFIASTPVLGLLRLLLPGHLHESLKRSSGRPAPAPPMGVD
jgi:hypothetical protein